MTPSNVVIGPWPNSGAVDELDAPPPVFMISGDPIFVILINGRPYRKDSAIRTYKTATAAERSARELVEIGRRYVGSHTHGKRVTIAQFAAINVMDVTAPVTVTP